MNFGTLYIVATPIGNLEDITLRALRVLKEVDLIFCEDTRLTRILLAKFGIKTPTESLNARTEKAKAERVVVLLRAGKNLALVTDAGTPGVSDPGAFLVSWVRESLPEISIVSVPGPSALTAALSIAGRPAAEFLFLGFLPHKKGREMLFKEIAASKRATVFYESPHRILKTLESLSKHAPERHVTICRELTKIHEEVKSASATELLEFFKTNQEKVKGEFVVIISN